MPLGWSVPRVCPFGLVPPTFLFRVAKSSQNPKILAPRRLDEGCLVGKKRNREICGFGPGRIPAETASRSFRKLEDSFIIKCDSSSKNSGRNFPVPHTNEREDLQPGCSLAGQQGTQRACVNVYRVAIPVGPIPHPPRGGPIPHPPRGCVSHIGPHVSPRLLCTMAGSAHV